MGFFSELFGFLFVADSNDRKKKRRINESNIAAERWEMEHNIAPKEVRDEFSRRFEDDKFDLGLEVSSWFPGVRFWDDMHSNCERRSISYWTCLGIVTGRDVLEKAYVEHLGYTYYTDRELHDLGYWDAVTKPLARKSWLDLLIESFFGP